MRISELLEREPFGEIVEETMSRHWTETLGTPVAVSWDGHAREGQVWRGNALLNFFAVDGARRECFDIIRREFSYTHVAWRRPLQSAYVRTAVRMPWRRWLSHVKFSTTPAIPDAESQVLLGGNRRMRLLRPFAGESVVIEKGGFNSLAMRREIEAREGPAGAIAPRLLRLADDRTWFVEEYVAGAPINRLGHERQVERRAEAVLKLNEQVYAGTRVSSTIAERIHAEMARVRIATQRAGTYSAPVTDRVQTAIELLAKELIQMAGEMPVPEVLSHGDFQDANILECSLGLRVIDWENAARRSAFYDAATLYSKVRLHPDWIARWEKVCRRWSDAHALPFALPTGVEWSPGTRSAWLGLWALEELVYQVEDAHAAAVDDTGVSPESVGRDVARIIRVLRSLRGLHRATT